MYVFIIRCLRRRRVFVITGKSADGQRQARRGCGRRPGEQRRRNSGKNTDITNEMKWIIVRLDPTIYSTSVDINNKFLRYEQKSHANTWCPFFVLFPDCCKLNCPVSFGLGLGGNAVHCTPVVFVFALDATSVFFLLLSDGGRDWRSRWPTFPPSHHLVMKENEKKNLFHRLVPFLPFFFFFFKWNHVTVSTRRPQRRRGDPCGWMQEAECEKASMDVKYNMDTKVEDNTRLYKLQKSNFDREINTAVSSLLFTRTINYFASHLFLQFAIFN